LDITNILHFQYVGWIAVFATSHNLELSRHREIGAAGKIDSDAEKN